MRRSLCSQDTRSIDSAPTYKLAHAVILPSFALRTAIHSPKSRSATRFAKDAMQQGVAKSAHGARNIGATRAANNGANRRRVGSNPWLRGGAWPRAARQGARGERRECSSSAERWVNNLFPHLLERCGSRRQKINDFRCLDFDGAVERTRTSTGFPASTSS